jgi:predicted small lipoprotein YifL
MANIIRVLAALALVGVTLTACGKRGTLETPGSAVDEAGASKSASAAGDGGAGEAKPEKQQSFILDPLLR